MVVDYRDLNGRTVKDRYSLPAVDETINMFKGANWFTKMDLQSGFHQVAIKEESRHKTAFRTRLGSYAWRVRPFGLCNAPSVFQRLMNRVLAENLNQFVIVYVDDIVIFSRSLEDHMKHIRWVLDALRKDDLKISWDKCEWARRAVEFCGHRVSGDIVQTMPDKIERIANLATP